MVVVVIVVVVVVIEVMTDVMMTRLVSLMWLLLANGSPPEPLTTYSPFMYGGGSCEGSGGGGDGGYDSLTEQFGIVYIV